MPLLGSRSLQLSGIRYKLSMHKKYLEESFPILPASRRRVPTARIRMSRLVGHSREPPPIN